MPSIEINDARLSYTDTGSGPETIVFAHGLLMNRGMYQAQVTALSGNHRCIAYDHRGQGESEVTVDGYDMDSQTEDAAALIRALDASPCHFVGLSMGGFIGLRLAIRYPELLRSLVLIATSADPESHDSARGYRRLNFFARWLGLRLLAGRIMPIMFGRTFLADPERAREREVWREQMAGAGRHGVVRTAAAVIERQGIQGQLGKVRTPTLILVGDEDAATPLEFSERMRDGIPGARMVVIGGAGHSSTIEQPEAINHELAAFLAGLEQAA